MNINARLFILAGVIFLYECSNPSNVKNKTTNKMTPDTASLYGFNRDFLKKYINLIELKRGNSAVLIAPGWQGRVMTSTTSGDNGYSFGWINHKLVSSGVIQPHINAFGGEERLWLGPEGGQFSIFFRKGDDFIYEKWQTPPFIDTMPYEVVSSSDTSAIFRVNTEIVNYTGTKFSLAIERSVSLVSANDLRKYADISLDELKFVAYSSENTLTNTGDREWNKETGLLSIWMLGMYNPSPSVIVVIPVIQGDESKLGKKVNDNYFGAISPDRLKVDGNHIFFRADGKSRGKIGIPPLRVSGVMGSYDSENNALTLLFCKLPEGIADYVNSAWEIQTDPYSGDAFNSYNDGPLEDGSQMGPFYELETSSPAAALKPGKSITHKQVTVHLTGDKKLLNEVSVKVLGVPLEKIENAFR